VGLGYLDVPTASGRWRHDEGTAFLFAYVDNTWSGPLQSAIERGYDIGVGDLRRMQDAAERASGRAVKNGLYLLNPQEMTDAMDGLPGMEDYRMDPMRRAYKGRPMEITRLFFERHLQGRGGEMDPMVPYLTQAMDTVRRQVKITTLPDYIGIVVGVISAIPGTETAASSYQYICTSADFGEQFVKMSCGSAEMFSVDIPYFALTYNNVRVTP